MSLLRPFTSNNFCSVRLARCRAVVSTLTTLALRAPQSARLASATAPLLAAPRRSFWALPARYVHAAAAASGEVVTINVPGMGDSITEGELKSWAVKVGEQVPMDGLVAEIETDKITVEIRAPKAGVVIEQLAKEGSAVRVGSALYKLQLGATGAAPPGVPPAAESKAAASKQESAPSPRSAPPQPPPQSAPAPSPAPQAAAKATPTPEASKQVVGGGGDEAPAITTPPIVGARTERRVKMKKIRVRTAERMKESQNTYASLTTFNEIDMSALMAMRNEYKDAFEKKHGIKLGFMSAFVKAASESLLAQPLVNAVIDGADIVYRDYVDISVAVAAPQGLMVPVLRNVETLSFAEIERQIAVFGEKAKTNKLTMEDMAGGTFSISNGGVFGSLMGTPIINAPQSAILGMHATKPRPVAVDGKVEIRPMMYVALTYDHRLIDGREAVTFLVSLKQLIEDPRRLLLNL